jgi:SAM-dependent methyltransferase
MTSPLALASTWDLVAFDYAEVTAPFFAEYAKVALESVNLSAGSRVVDIAAGPGTLALVAAQQQHAVTAVDVSSAMIDELKRRAHSMQLNIETHVADGQALPLADASQDAAFSMFGLIFFPDRAKGFTEMYRVLAPGGTGVIASWQPMERFALLADIFAALRGLLPNMPFGDGKAPLGDPQDIVNEMTASGFQSVSVREVSASTQEPTLDQTWQFMLRGSAPLALLRRNVGEAAWQGIEQGILERLRGKYGPGAQTVTMVANLGIGYRSR